MRLTMRSNLAMRTLMYCAVHQGHTVRRHDIAQACNASENHLAQVIHLLAQKGFVQTLRGRRGGLALGRPAEQITVGEVLRSFEAPLPFADCFDDGAAACPLAGACRLSCALAEAVEAFYSRLDRTTLCDLVQGNVALGRLLRAA